MLTTTTPSVVAANARAAHAVLEHAERVGLPMPHTVTVTGFDWTATILHFESLVELTEWSRWTETPIVDDDVAGNIHHRVTAVELDHRIECVTITKGAGR